MEEIQNAINQYLGSDDQVVQKLLGQVYIILLISVPLSLLFYLLFNKYKHSILVDLGHHKWLVK